MDEDKCELGLQQEELYLPLHSTFIYYNRPDNDKRVDFYDTNEEFINCLYLNDKDLQDLLEKMKGYDLVSLFSLFDDSPYSHCGFDYSTSIKGLLETLVETMKNNEEDCTEVEEDIKAIDDLTADENDLIAKYDINQIGTMYFRGDWF